MKSFISIPHCQLVSFFSLSRLFISHIIFHCYFTLEWDLSAANSFFYSSQFKAILRRDWFYPASALTLLTTSWLHSTYPHCSLTSWMYYPSLTKGRLKLSRFHSHQQWCDLMSNLINSMKEVGLPLKNSILNLRMIQFEQSFAMMLSEQERHSGKLVQGF